MKQKTSSEIENIITTHDEIYKALLKKDGKYDPETKEVLRLQRSNMGGL